MDIKGSKIMNINKDGFVTYEDLLKKNHSEVIYEIKLKCHVKEIDILIRLLEDVKFRARHENGIKLNAGHVL